MLRYSKAVKNPLQRRRINLLQRILFIIMQIQLKMYLKAEIIATFFLRFFHQLKTSIH